MEYTEKLYSQVMAQKPQAREKALLSGIGSLSNLELVMLLIGSGTKDIPVTKLARSVLEHIMTDTEIDDPQKICTIKGMGMSKSILVIASLELGRRINGNKITVTKPTDILPLIRHYALEQQEHFLCVSLNGAHCLQKIHVVSVGTLNRSLVHPREIFSQVLVDRAAAILVCHNHPSGNTDPSQEDIEATMRIKDAALILGIRFLDHIIFTTNDYFSFQEHNLL